MQLPILLAWDDFLILDGLAAFTLSPRSEAVMTSCCPGLGRAGSSHGLLFVVQIIEPQGGSVTSPADRI